MNLSRIGNLFIPPAAAGDTPPSDHLYASAVWLARRHPTLLHLADRAGVRGPLVSRLRDRYRTGVLAAALMFGWLFGLLLHLT